MIDDADMRGRVLVLGGAVVAVVALAGLGVYFSRVGLEQADKLASVIGLFVAVAGLGVAVNGMISDRRSGGDVQQRAEASGHGLVYQAGRDINEGPPGQLMASEVDADGSGAADDEAGRVQQRAKVTGNGQVYQADRDINKP